jgi:hypothetical protein
MDNLFSMLSKQLDGQNLAQLQQMMMNMPQMHEMIDNIQLNSSPSPSATAETNSLDLNKMFMHEMAQAKKSEEYNKRAPIPCPHLDRSTTMRLVKEELKEFSAKGIKMRNTWITGL